jgi:hypothetical protein
MAIRLGWKATILLLAAILIPIIATLMVRGAKYAAEISNRREGQKMVVGIVRLAL